MPPGMKISLLRGAFLSPYELQLYAPLAKQHTLTAIGADWQLYRYPLEFPGVRIERAPLWAGKMGSPPPLNRLLSWTLGRSYGLCGLERLVGKTDILHAAETFFTMSYQSLLIKRKTGCRLVVTVSENIAHSGETHPI